MKRIGSSRGGRPEWAGSGPSDDSRRFRLTRFVTPQPLTCRLGAGSVALSSRLAPGLPSSSGLGRGPLKAKTRVRFPLGAPSPRMPDFAFAFIDCEFGGLDPELHDITEIAVILTDYRLAEI